MRLEPHLKLPVGAGAAGAGALTGRVSGVALVTPFASPEPLPEPAGWRSTAGTVFGVEPEFGMVRTTTFATGPLPPIAGRMCADSAFDARWIVKPKRGFAVGCQLAPVVPEPNIAPQVMGPTMPSTCTPAFCWNVRTAASVRGPK